mgnify:CR=1 FL=1
MRINPRGPQSGAAPKLPSAPPPAMAQGNTGTASDTFGRKQGAGDRDLPDPAVLTKDAQSLSYRRVEGGKLFVDGISYDDVIQGSIANCYMMSSFSALAYTSADVLANAIKDNGDGTFTVAMYSDAPGGGMVSTPQTVDATVAMSSYGNRSNYGHARVKEELWISVLEKAYAQLRGGYDAVGNGGHPGHIFSTVLGQQHTWYTIEQEQPDELFAALVDATRSRRPMASETHGKDSGVSYNGTGLHAWHSYSVLGAVEEEGKRFVLMRNPWGNSEPGNDGKNDGSFKIPFEEFMKQFSVVTVG